jgi:hypothetical protein
MKGMIDMPWTCRLVDDRDKAEEIGDMYFSESYTQYHTSEFLRVLSPEYRRDWFGKRPPLFVITPVGPWCIDAVSTDGNGNNNNHGWTVLGEVPNITVSPSINFEGYYHGWLQNGLLTDDCEGRVF